jgi:hypothetical protein
VSRTIFGFKAETLVAIEGRLYFRVCYGDEKEDWGADEQPCGDCGVEKRQVHVAGCDIERCPACNSQAISCACSGKRG